MADLGARESFSLLHTSLLAVREYVEDAASILVSRARSIEVIPRTVRNGTTRVQGTLAQPVPIELLNGSIRRDTSICIETPIGPLKKPPRREPQFYEKKASEVRQLLYGKLQIASVSADIAKMGRMMKRYDPKDG